MRTILRAAAILTMSLTAIAAADDAPVVVELYTSQGCSSCPPADALLAELAERDDVIPLALHVDYWDYIGWKDEFADPAHTKRQKKYAYAAGQRTIYTPQMIVGGVDHVVGYKPMRLAELIERHGRKASDVEVSLERSGGDVLIKAKLVGDDTYASTPMVVQLVRYNPSSTVQIRRGENAGRTITYSNVVTELSVLKSWNGKAPLSMKAPADGDAPLVVLVQAPGHGPILGAARLN